MKISLKVRVVSVCLVFAAALAGVAVWLLTLVAARGAEFLAHPVLLVDVLLIGAIYGLVLLSAFFVLVAYLEASGKRG